MKYMIMVMMMMKKKKKSAVMRQREHPLRTEHCPSATE